MTMLAELTCEHADDGGICSDCFDREHARAHPDLVDGCFACKLGTIQLDAKLHLARATKYVPPRKHDNPWERGVVGQHRPDGSFMPYVDRDFTPLSTKRFADNRSRNEETIRQHKNGIIAPVPTQK